MLIVYRVCFILQRVRSTATSATPGRMHAARIPLTTPPCRAISRPWWRATAAAWRWCGIRDHVSSSDEQQEGMIDNLSKVHIDMSLSGLPSLFLLQRTRWCDACVRHSYKSIYSWSITCAWWKVQAMDICAFVRKICAILVKVYTVTVTSISSSPS